MSDDARGPTPDEVDPNALGVDSLPDETRTHADPDETESAHYTGGHLEPTETEPEESRDSTKTT